MTAHRKLILYMSMSLDGYGAAPDGSMPWFEDRPSHAAHRQHGVAELLGQTGLLVLGRTGGQQMAQAWPGSESPTGRLMNELPKLVFSSTIDRLDWANTTVTDRPLAETIDARKAEPGKDIVAFGGVAFARSLAEHGLIDEYRINVQPVTLGEGLPLLPAGLRLTLVASTAWSDGPVTHHYIPR